MTLPHIRQLLPGLLLFLVAGLCHSREVLAEPPSHAEAAAQMAAQYGVSPSDVQITSITLTRTEQIGDTIYEHYRIEALINGREVFSGNAPDQPLDLGFLDGSYDFDPYPGYEYEPYEYPAESDPLMTPSFDQVYDADYSDLDSLYDDPMYRERRPASIQVMLIGCVVSGFVLFAGLMAIVLVVARATAPAKPTVPPVPMVNSATNVAELNR